MADALVERLDRAIALVLAGRDATAALADAELSLLAVLASELRSCPSLAFKARLRANLERRSTMSMVLEKAQIREGFTTVTPYIRVREAGLRDFLTTVFGAVETSVTTTGGDSVHREVRVGDSMVMIGAQPALLDVHRAYVCSDLRPLEPMITGLVGDLQEDDES